MLILHHKKQHVNIDAEITLKMNLDNYLRQARLHQRLFVSSLLRKGVNHNT